LWNQEGNLRPMFEEHTSELSQNMARPHGVWCLSTGARLIREMFGEPSKESWFYKLAQNGWFHLLGLVFTLANCVAVAIDADVTIAQALSPHANARAEGAIAWERQLNAVQRGFLAWLMFEIVVQVIGTRSDFFLGSERGWNMLDVCILLVSFFMALDQDSSGSSSYLRAFRIAKTSRAIRAVRFVRYSQSLQRMMSAAAPVAVSLFWTGCVLLIFSYIFGVAMLEGVANFASDAKLSGAGSAIEMWQDSQFGSSQGAGSDATLLEALRMHYGGMGRTMVTLFRAMSGADWGMFAAPLAATGGIWGAVWVAYVFVAIYGISSIAIAIIVNIIRRPLPVDHTVNLMAERQEESALAVALANELKRQPVGGCSGTMEMPAKAFNRLVRSPRVVDILRAYGIDVARLGEVFQLADVEKQGVVTVQAAAVRLMALRGYAKSEDVTRLTGEVLQLKAGVRFVAEAIKDLRLSLRKAAGEAVYV